MQLIGIVAESALNAFIETQSRQTFPADISPASLHPLPIIRHNTSLCRIERQTGQFPFGSFPHTYQTGADGHMAAGYQFYSPFSRSQAEDYLFLRPAGVSLKVFLIFLGLFLYF
jgi:hypothetical protein